MVIANKSKRSEGSPIKRLLSTAKKFPMQEKKIFHALLVFSRRHRYHSRYFYLFRCQPLLHQSPIRIKAVVEVVEVQQPFPRFADQKTFGSPPGRWTTKQETECLHWSFY
jgi:hypothetical protein